MATWSSSTVEAITLVGSGVTAAFTTSEPNLEVQQLYGESALRGWECFDADSGKDLAVELREYFIPDFSHWKDHAPFETAFARLLNDLRAEDRLR